MEIDIDTAPRLDVVDVGKPRNRKFNRNIFTLVMFTLATFIQYFNLQFLPSCMRALEMSLRLSPADLTNLNMAENFGFVAFFPVWGILSDVIELKYIIMLGVVGSGIVSIWMAGISNYTLIFFLRILNGAMIGTVTPSSQKFVVTHMRNYFGIAFGVLHSVMCAARMLSGIVITTYSTGTYMGRSGWRICLFAFGAIAMTLSPLMYMIPSMIVVDGEKVEVKIAFAVKVKMLARYLLTMLKESLSNATSILMVFMNFFSDGPFAAFSFVTLLIQYMGLSNIKAGVTSSLIIMGGIVGGVSGGLTSDYIDRKFPRYGLILFANLNVIVRTATFGVAFFAVNLDNVGILYPLLAASLFVNGMTYMTVSCVDRSIIAGVVQEKYQSKAIAIIRCIAGVASTLIFNPILAKLRVDVFGFKKTSLDVSEMPRELLVKNSDALRYSIAIVTMSTTGVVFIIYTILSFTYWRDLEKTKARAALESGIPEPEKELERTP